MRTIASMIAGICIITFGIALQAASIESGFAVTNMRVPRDRNTGTPPISRIIRYNIKDDRVTDTAVLYSIEAAKVLRPRISFDGKKIAFCSPKHLMVMDADGGNQRELTGIPDLDWYDNRKVTLDFPKGNWIYYRKNDTQIWRYNIASDNDELFIDYKNPFRKWACNVTADHIAVQDNMCNMVHSYPLGGFVFGEDCNIPGCNIGISTSGTLLSWFTGTAHNDIHHGSWDGSGEAQKLGTWHNDRMSGWYGSDIGKGMDWPLWATNSDLWMCLQIKLDGRFSKGSNQVLFNWANQRVIRTSTNSSSSLTFYSGDLWVRPPTGKEGHYQAATGEWVVPGTSVSTLPEPHTSAVRPNSIQVRQPSSGMLTVTAPRAGSYRVSLFDAAGKLVLSRTIAGKLQAAPLNSRPLPGGTYLVTVEDGGRSRGEFLIVAR